MQSVRVLFSAAIAAAALIAPLPSASTQALAENWIGRSVTLAGRNVSCGKAEIMVDTSLPSEGGAGDDFLVLNPEMMNQQPATVRLFVFSHECGHLTVGDSELQADCFAVNRGVREGWLNRNGLKQVCQSFDGAPETESHPSAARRCQNLDRCFAAATTAKQSIVTASTVPAVPDLPVRKQAALGHRKELSAWRCSAEEAAKAQDPIAGLIETDKNPACR